MRDGYNMKLLSLLEVLFMFSSCSGGVGVSSYARLTCDANLVSSE